MRLDIYHSSEKNNNCVHWECFHESVMMTIDTKCLYTVILLVAIKFPRPL